MMAHDSDRSLSSDAEATSAATKKLGKYLTTQNVLQLVIMGVMIGGFYWRIADKLDYTAQAGTDNDTHLSQRIDDTNKAVDALTKIVAKDHDLVMEDHTLLNVHVSTRPFAPTPP